MINAELLNRAGISYEAGIKRFMDDSELYEAVLTAFLNEDILQRAEAAYAKKDTAKLLAVVHESKGSGGNAGLDKIYIEASALVKLLRSPSFTDEELKLGYERFTEAYSSARNCIKAALGK